MEIFTQVALWVGVALAIPFGIAFILVFLKGASSGDESESVQAGFAWRNKKNEKLYRRLFNARDCTNSRDGATVVVYEDESGSKYVRDENEFYDKFDFVGAGIPTK